MLLRYSRSNLYRRFSKVASNVTEHTKDFLQEEYSELNSYFPQVIRDVCEKDFIKKIPGLSERYETLLNYTVNIGDMKRMSSCLLPLFFYKRLEKPTRLTEDNLKKAYALSWALRMIEAPQVIIDDVIDDSDLRYGKPSWKKLEGINKSILDSWVIENAAYLLLHKELKNHPNFPKIMHLLKYGMFETVVGQMIDILPVDFEISTELFKYRLYKCHYEIELPIRAAMYLANLDNPVYHEKVADLTRQSSEFISIQNDYWGVFAPFAEYKKICNDITEGKTNWLLVKALEMASPEQSKIIKENYGKPTKESEMKVKNIYVELKLDDEYKRFTIDYFDALYRKIEELPAELPRNVFYDMLKMLRSGSING